MKRYRTLFFDLDNTLWDFSANSDEAFAILYERYGLARHGVTLERLLEVYHRHNDRMWEDYRQGRVDKETLRWKRFFLTFSELGFGDEELARRFESEYLATAREMTRLVEGAREVLEILRGRYRLFLLTNGFNEVQFFKVEHSGLAPYFEKVITSEMAGALKPHPRFFRYALEVSGADADTSLMIGDDVAADIEGAAAAGIDTVLFNPRRRPHEAHPTYEITRLRKLLTILEEA